MGDAAALEREGLFVAEGRLVVERLIEDGRFAVHSVLVTPSAARALRAVLEGRPFPIHVRPPQDLRELTGFDFHRGCLALAHRPHEPPPFDWSRASRVLAIEGVADPDNVGGLFRTALALGVDAIILDRATADPLYRKAVRTSMAATLRVPFWRVDDWLERLESLRGRGLRLVALTPHPDAVRLAGYAAGAHGRFVLLVGSEATGLAPGTLQLADERVRIPVDPRADSLNVVSAAAIALHALSRLT